MAPKPPAEAAPAKAALSIVGAITAALFAVAYAVSQQRHDNAPRFDPRYCEGGLRPRPSWALAQPRRFAPVPLADGSPAPSICTSHRLEMDHTASLLPLALLTCYLIEPTCFSLRWAWPSGSHHVTIKTSELMV